MGIGRDNNGDTLETIGAAPDMTGNVTLMSWVRVEIRGGTWEALISVGDDSLDWTAGAILISDSGGNLRLYSRGTNIQVGSALTDGRWYHACIYGDMGVFGTLNAVLYDSVTGNEQTLGGTGGTTTFTEDRVYFGADPSDEVMLGVWQFGKCWERALTLNEIRTERWSGRAIYRQNLWGEWPMHDVSETLDRSGNARSLTVTGSVTIADGPPVAWEPDLFTQDTGIFAAGGGGGGVNSTLLTPMRNRPLMHLLNR